MIPARNITSAAFPQWPHLQRVSQSALRQLHLDDPRPRERLKSLYRSLRGDPQARRAFAELLEADA